MMNDWWILLDATGFYRNLSISSVDGLEADQPWNNIIR